METITILVDPVLAKCLKPYGKPECNIESSGKDEWRQGLKENKPFNPYQDDVGDPSNYVGWSYEIE